MATLQQLSELDNQFYQPADAFFATHRQLALTYDDVSLATLYSEILPRDTQLDTTLAEGLQLNIPILSADMDTVTESRMAIAMALNGALGLLHHNMSEQDQLSEVDRVKNHVHGLIREPVKVAPEQLIGDVLEMIDKRKFAFSTFPVVDAAGRLLGLLSGHVVKPRYAKRKVASALTPRSQVQTIGVKELGSNPIARADKFFNDHPGIHKLLVVDEQDRLHGLFTMSDVERITQERAAQFKPARDSRFRLLCGASLSATRNAFGELDRARILTHVQALVERGVDVVAVSTAHGHTKGVGEAVRTIRDACPALPIIAGNVTSAAETATCSSRAVSSRRRQDVTFGRLRSSARRSRSVMPPQTPHSIWLSRASARHSVRTGQPAQSCLARFWAAPRTNSSSGRLWLHEAFEAQSSFQFISAYPSEMEARLSLPKGRLVG